MVRCIILDGWHKGEMVTFPQAPPNINFARLAHTIVCDCDPYQPGQEFPSPATVDTYQLAFRAIDGETALYSKNGKSEAVWREVGSLLRRERPVGLHTITIDCHDEKAWQ